MALGLGNLGVGPCCLVWRVCMSLRLPKYWAHVGHANQRVHRVHDTGSRLREEATASFRRRLRSSSVEFILATAAASALRRTRLSRSVMIASVGLVTRRRFRRAAVLSCVMCAGLRP